MKKGVLQDVMLDAANPMAGLELCNKGKPDIKQPSDLKWPLTGYEPSCGTVLYVASVVPEEK